MVRIVSRLVAAVVLAVSAGGPITPLRAAETWRGPLYVLPFGSTGLLRLDPETLVNRGASLRVRSIGQIAAMSTLYDGGTTLTAVSYLDGSDDSTEPASRIVISTYRLATGRRIATVHPAVPLQVTGVSGMQIVGTRAPIPTRRFSTWYSLDARTGKVRYRVVLRTAGDVEDLQYDAARHRLYTLVWVGRGTVTDDVRVTVFNVRTGRAITSVRVPGVNMGLRGTPPLSSTVFPGFALSRSGREVAVYDTLAERITILDALHMRQTGALIVHTPQSLCDTIASAVGLLPAPALAKGSSSGSLATMFDWSGASIFAYVVRPGSLKPELQRIDLHDGRIMASAAVPDGTIFFGVSPGNHNVYTGIIDVAATSGAVPIARVQRRDPLTLRVTAQSGPLYAPAVEQLGPSP